MKLNPGALVKYGTPISGYRSRYVGSCVEKNEMQEPIRNYAKASGQRSNLAIMITLDRPLGQFEWCLVMSLDAYGVQWHNAQMDVNIKFA